MNKNLRRSIVIAAGVSGAWALGSAVASADEQPAHSVSQPDRPIEAAGDASADGADVHLGVDVQHTVARVTHVTETAHEAVTQTTHAAVHHVAQVSQGVASHATPAAHGAVDDATGVAQGAAGQAGHTTHRVAGDAAQGAHGVVGQVARGAQSGDVAPGPVARTVGHVQARAAEAGQHVAQAPAAVQEEVDYLFGPLSAFAPELAASQSAAAPATAHTAARAEAPAVAHTTVAQSAAAPAAAHTMAAPAADASTMAFQPADLPDAVTGAVLQSPPVAAVVTTLTDASAAIHDGLPADPVSPGSLPHTALQVVGDVLYTVDGIKDDVQSGRVPDTVPQDAALLVQHLATGLGGQSIAGQ